MTHLRSLHGTTALVTGASGFIGSAICRALGEAGAHVHGLSRVQRAGGPCKQWWVSALTDLAEVRSIVAAARPDFIFHLAGDSGAARDLALVAPTIAANLTPTVNLLIAATEWANTRLLLPGSLEEPDPGIGLPVPSSPYAAAKFAASAYARMFHALYAAPVVILRVFMVYGAGQRDTRKLIPYVTLSLLRGKIPELSSGRRQVDWVYVDDVVNAYLAAATAEKVDGQTFEVGTGILTGVDEIVHRLVKIINPAIQPRFGAVADRPHEQVRMANVGPTTTALGWRPEVDVDRGLRQTADWFRQQLRAGTIAE